MFSGLNHTQIDKRLSKTELHQGFDYNKYDRFKTEIDEIEEVQSNMILKKNSLENNFNNI